MKRNYKKRSKFNDYLSYSKKFRITFLVFLIALFYLSLASGYALLSKSFSVSTDVAIRPNRDIRIVDVEGPILSGGAYETKNYRFSHDLLDITATLPNSDSKIQYKLTIKNSSGVNKAIKSVTDTFSSPGFSYEFTNFDIDDVIRANSSVVLVVTVSKTGSVSNFNSEFIFEYVDAYNKYENGTAVYYNPGTNRRCTASQANSTPGTKTGCMKWYTFNDRAANGTVDIILDHNTTEAVAWSTTASNTTNANTLRAQLSSDTSRWNRNINPRIISVNEIAKITKNKEFDSDNPDLDLWFFLENNTQNAPSLGIGQAKYKWLFDYTGNCLTYGCSNENSSGWGWWLLSPYISTNDSAWYVSSYGSVTYNLVTTDYAFGLRPAVTINKSIIG